MDWCLIKLKPVTCQSPHLPAIHLTESSIKNGTCVQRNTISVKYSWSFFTFFDNHTDAAVQGKADRWNGQMSISERCLANFV